ncbi:hypothetical protein CPB85DRAFT_1433457 [Mucidula mucida]|nr:hypothetical protein CPB85DRAFT_1433457 [Mucidula mucida]
MSQFDPSEWLGKGKIYKDTPPKVQRAANAALLIPDTIRNQLIPKGSLHDLCTFTMPIFQGKTSLQDNIIIQFFSTHKPDVVSDHTISQLCYLTMPATSASHQIYKLAHQAWLDGMQSICYVHLADNGSSTVIHFPLFVAALWKEFAEIQTIRSQWQKLSEYVAKHMHQPKYPELHEGYAMDQSIGILQDDMPVHHLYRMVGDGWWSSSLVNIQLSLLAERARDRLGLSNVRVELCEFTNVLVSQYKARDRQSYQHPWLCGVGDTIINERGTLVTGVNLGKVNDNPHWVPLVINGETGQAHYGDSLCEDLPPTLQHCIDWWLAQHTPSPSHLWAELPITVQLDSNNCAVLWWTRLRIMWTPAAD